MKTTMKENKTTTFEKFNELVLKPYWVWLARLSAVFCLVVALTASCGLALTIMGILPMLLTWPSFFYQLHCFRVAVKEDSLLAGKYPHIRNYLGSQEEFIDKVTSTSTEELRNAEDFLAIMN